VSLRRALRLRWMAPVAVGGALSCAAVGAAFHSGPAPRAESATSVLGGQVVKGNGDDSSAASFVVSGDVAGLAPGVTRTLSLRLSNPNGSAISVEVLEVTVGDSATGCSAGTLRVGAFTGPVLVPGGGEAQASLPVTMAASAPSVCQGATFPLTYGGSAVKG
jgi:hypothetical protein